MDTKGQGQVYVSACLTEPDSAPSTQFPRSSPGEQFPASISRGLVTLPMLRVLLCDWADYI